MGKGCRLATFPARDKGAPGNCEGKESGGSWADDGWHPTSSGRRAPSGPALAGGGGRQSGWNRGTWRGARSGEWGPNDPPEFETQDFPLGGRNRAKTTLPASPLGAWNKRVVVVCTLRCPPLPELCLGPCPGPQARSCGRRLVRLPSRISLLAGCCRAGGDRYNPPPGKGREPAPLSQTTSFPSFYAQTDPFLPSRDYVPALLCAFLGYLVASGTGLGGWQVVLMPPLTLPGGEQEPGECQPG